MKQLALVKPGVFSAQDRKKMERNGFVVIEAADFSAVKLVNTEFMLTSDTFAIAALETLMDYRDYSKDEKFAKRILAAIKKNAAVPAPDADGRTT